MLTGKDKKYCFLLILSSFFIFEGCATYELTRGVNKYIKKETTFENSMINFDCNNPVFYVSYNKKSDDPLNSTVKFLDQNPSGFFKIAHRHKNGGLGNIDYRYKRLFSPFEMEIKKISLEMLLKKNVAPLDSRFSNLHYRLDIEYIEPSFSIEFLSEASMNSILQKPILREKNKANKRSISDGIVAKPSIEKVWRNKFGGYLPHCGGPVIWIKSNDELTETFVQGEQYKGGIVAITEIMMPKLKIVPSDESKSNAKDGSSSMSYAGYDGIGRSGSGKGKRVFVDEEKHHIKGIEFRHTGNGDARKRENLTISGDMNNCGLSQLYLKKNENHYRQYPVRFKLAVQTQQYKHPLWERVLLFPLALTFDVVTSPLQLVLFLTAGFWMPA